MTETTAATVSFPATVVRVIDDTKVVINRGAKHGVRNGQHFLVYYLDTNPIEDPETGRDLGQLEIVRGTGIATHVQENLTTVSSNRKGPTGHRKVVRSSIMHSFSTEEETTTVPGNIEPFDHAARGDKVKPI